MYLTQTCCIRIIMDESLSARFVQKTFTFENSDSALSLAVSIPEILHPEYGMYVWPCAVVLSQYVWTARELLQKKTVLELGAGVSLPGVVAAKCGAQVILSDSAELPLCLHNCKRSCEANDVADVPVVGLTWGQVSPALLSLPPVDVILGSDVFYEPEDFEDVLVTVSFLLKCNPYGQFWTTYQERSTDWSIETLLHKWNLKCINVPLETFHANRNHLAGSTLPGNHTIQMMIVTAEVYPISRSRLPVMKSLDSDALSTCSQVGEGSIQCKCYRIGCGPVWPISEQEWIKCLIPGILKGH